MFGNALLPQALPVCSEIFLWTVHTQQSGGLNSHSRPCVFVNSLLFMIQVLIICLIQTSALMVSWIFLEPIFEIRIFCFTDLKYHSSCKLKVIHCLIVQHFPLWITFNILEQLTMLKICCFSFYLYSITSCNNTMVWDESFLSAALCILGWELPWALPWWTWAGGEIRGFFGVALS